jgi:hypothetical protein
MIMNTPRIDLLTILIAAAVNLVIGMVWYSRFLFKTNEEPTVRHRKITFLWHSLTVLLTAYVLAIIAVFLGVTTVIDGMFVGFLVWLGFSATTQIASVIWGKMPFKRFCVHAGCQLLNYLVMGGILGA